MGGQPRNPVAFDGKLQGVSEGIGLAKIHSQNVSHAGSGVCAPVITPHPSLPYFLSSWLLCWRAVTHNIFDKGQAVVKHHVRRVWG